MIIMATLRANDVRKLSKEQSIAKISEMEKLLLELEGEGRQEKKKSVKKAIARLKTHLTAFDIKARLIERTKPKAKAA